MHTSDDANIQTTVLETVAALREGASRIGKADQALDAEQVREIEAAIADLQSALRTKDST